jgi:prepilin-type N-terminal cleavage/methylation domain-containing protein
MRTNQQAQQAGFTLVEMLVVIVIIGILAAFLIPAVTGAWNKAIDGRIAIEVANIQRAVEAYKENHGDYPPNTNDLALIRRHMKTAFPKIDNSELISVADLLANYLDPAEAIPFWLGGFSSNKKFPFTGPGGPLVFYNGNFYANPERNTGLHEFDEARLTLDKSITVLDPGPPPIQAQLSTDGDTDSFPVYIAYGSKLPLVYFDARSYGSAFYAPNPSMTGAAKPYLSDRDKPTSPLGKEWVNKDSFQIISAGRDNHYGSAAILGPPPDPSLHPIYPSGVRYILEDNDNIASFSEGSKLEDMKP